MKRPLRAVFPAVVSVLLLTACPYTPPPLPDPYDYVGAWTGTLNDSVGGAGDVAVEVITQSDDYGGALGGSWAAKFGDVASNGILRGGYGYGNAMSLNLVSSAAPDCFYSVEATRTDDTVRGTYLSNGCTPYVTGTLELTKQP